MPPKAKTVKKVAAKKQPLNLEQMYKEIIETKDSEIKFLRGLVSSMIEEGTDDAKNSTSSVI